MDKQHSQKLKQELYQAAPENIHEGLDSLFRTVSYENYSPVKRLEETLGISGVYHNYNIPEDAAPLTYESWLQPIRIFEVVERGINTENKLMAETSDYMNSVKNKYFFEARQAYNEIKELNPEIADIKFKPSIKNYVAVISGVCSGFPPEDINEFIQASSPQANQEINDRKAAYTKELEKRTGISRINPLTGKFQLIDNWCPTEKTFKKITAKLDAKKEKTKSSFSYDAFDAFRASHGYYDD